MVEIMKYSLYISRQINQNQLNIKIDNSEIDKKIKMNDKHQF